MECASNTDKESPFEFRILYNTNTLWILTNLSIDNNNLKKNSKYVNTLPSDIYSQITNVALAHELKQLHTLLYLENINLNNNSNNDNNNNNNKVFIFSSNSSTVNPSPYYKLLHFTVEASPFINSNTETITNTNTDTNTNTNNDKNNDKNNQNNNKNTKKTPRELLEELAAEVEALSMQEASLSVLLSSKSSSVDINLFNTNNNINNNNSIINNNNNNTLSPALQSDFTQSLDKMIEASSQHHSDQKKNIKEQINEMIDFALSHGLSTLPFLTAEQNKTINNYFTTFQQQQRKDVQRVKDEISKNLNPDADMAINIIKTLNLDTVSTVSKGNNPRSSSKTAKQNPFVPSNHTALLTAAEKAHKNVFSEAEESISSGTVNTFSSSLAITRDSLHNSLSKGQTEVAPGATEVTAQHKNTKVSLESSVRTPIKQLRWDTSWLLYGLLFLTEIILALILLFYSYIPKKML